MLVFAVLVGMAAAMPPRPSSVPIPPWSEPVLYRKDALDRLSERFDLSLFRSRPRIRIAANRAKGVFALDLHDGGEPRSFAIRTLSRGEARNVVTLAIRVEGREAAVTVFLSADGTIPVEANLRGFGERYDRDYAAVTRLREGSVRVFASAEQELAENWLPGSWSGEGRRTLEVVSIPGSLPLVRFGDSEVLLDLARAPEGTDLLLVPPGGSPPLLSLRLRGPDALEILPVRCEKSGRCRAEGPAERWRRRGARVNVR